MQKEGYKDVRATILGMVHLKNQIHRVGRPTWLPLPAAPFAVLQSANLPKIKAVSLDIIRFLHVNDTDHHLG